MTATLACSGFHGPKPRNAASRSHDLTRNPNLETDEEVELCLQPWQLLQLATGPATTVRYGLDTKG